MSDHIVKADVLVVGAGPAGSAAAREVARSGRKVILVDRRKIIGRPVRCAEYAPAAVLGELHCEPAVVQRTDQLVLHLPGGKQERLSSPGVVLDRAHLDDNLARSAEEAGAILWRQCPVAAVSRSGKALLGGERQGEAVAATLVVGADGPSSLVARAARLGSPRVMIGLQRTVTLSRGLDEGHIFFWHRCRHGYGWLFPKGKTANLGVALPRGDKALARDAMAHLVSTLAQQGVIETGGGDENRGDPGRSGLVPCSGPLPRLGAGRFLLAGDAAGQTDPLTGAGIVAALRGGSAAGRAAVKALDGNRWQDASRTYDSGWRAAYGRGAARSLERRFTLEGLWDRNFERAIRRAWLPASQMETDHG